MIVITGAAGFIGSCLLGRLNEEGYSDILIVDDFSKAEKLKNLEGKKYAQKTERSDFFNWCQNNHHLIHFVFHIGARTDTAEFNMEVLNELNLDYSKKIWTLCSQHNIPLVYASSAATYGLGELGYKDSHEVIPFLKPLNPYGISKNEFDKWVLQQKISPPFWAGLKFFNVYGPNEYHKARMASVIFHGFNQIKQKGYTNLFRSHRPDYKDGMQLRDFVYVKDVVKICLFLMNNRNSSGIFNLGTAKARSFWDLATATFEAMNIKPDIRFIDTPLDIRDKYQYFTQADMDKLCQYGYTDAFYTLEDGIKDYVQQYLIPNKYF